MISMVKPKFSALFLVSICLIGLFFVAVVPQNVSAAYTGSISYSVASNTITVTGVNVWTGSAWGFFDLWNASYYNGWWVVNNKTSIAPSTSWAQYALDCKLVVGDGSTATFFADSLKSVVLNSGVIFATNQIWLSVNSKANLTFGSLIDATLKTSKNGIDFISLEATYTFALISGAGTSSSIVNVYSCSFQSLSHCSVDYVTKLYNSKFSAIAFPSTRAFDAFNNVLDGGRYLNVVAPSTGTPTVNKLNILSPYDNYYVRDASNFNNTLSNVYGRGSTKAVWVTGAGTLYLINPDFDVWLFQWDASATVYRQYEFDLTITNGITALENSHVTLTKGSTVISCLTNSTGQIDTQTLTYGYYDQAHGNAIQDSGAWTLTVTKDGYINYNSSFTPLAKNSFEIALEPSEGYYGEVDLVSIGLFACIIVGVVCFGVFFVAKRQKATG